MAKRDEGLSRLIDEIKKQQDMAAKKARESISDQKELQEELSKINREYSRILATAEKEYRKNKEINDIIRDRNEILKERKNTLLQELEVLRKQGEQESRVYRDALSDLEETNRLLNSMSEREFKLSLYDVDSEVEKLKKIKKRKIDLDLQHRIEEIRSSELTAEQQEDAIYEAKLRARKRYDKEVQKIEEGKTKEAQKAAEKDKKAAEDAEKKRREKGQQEKLEETFGTSEIGIKQLGIALLGELTGQPIRGGNLGEEKEATPLQLAVGALRGKKGDDISEEINTGIAKFNDTIGKVLAPYFEMVNKNLEKAEEAAAKYLGAVDTRLQGISEEQKSYYKQFLGAVMENGGSVLINQTKWMENIASLVDRGIAQEVEGQALIATLSDRIVTTFDVLSEDLRRLIRLQQSNITASQAGVESSITQFLNKTFMNTEYLGTSRSVGIYDTVKSAIIDALSQMNVDQATSFEFAVQKWLGSLYSLGASQQTISTLASGLNMLTTGNVQGLSNNIPLQTLFAISAQNAGLSYAELLTGGLDADNVDKLMKSMVEYLGEIANNTSNRVLRSEWSNILGISISDLRTISTLTQNQDIINSIMSQSIENRKSAEDVFQEQVEQIGSRTTFTDMVDTFMENLAFTFGSTLFKNDLTYFGYKLGRIADDAGDFLGKFFPKLGAIVGIIGKAISVSATIPAALATTGAAFNMVGTAFQALRPGGESGISDDYVELMLGEDSGGIVNFFQNLSSTKNSVLASAGNISPRVAAAISAIIEKEEADQESEYEKSLSGVIEESSQSATPSYSNKYQSTSQQIQTFENYSSNVESQATSVVQATEESTDTIEKLYNDLFESEKSIKVKLTDIGESALIALAAALLSKEDLQQLQDKLDALGANDVILYDNLRQINVGRNLY